MPLHLYRRHRPGCEGGHAEEARSGEFEERKKGWKRCACVIFISGTLGGKFSRKATGTADWAEAHQVTETYETVDSWTGIPQPESVVIPEPVAAAPLRITIDEACKVFLATREATVAHRSRGSAASSDSRSTVSGCRSPRSVLTSSRRLARTVTSTRRRAINTAELIGLPPRVDFRSERVDIAQRSMHMAVHRKALVCLPPSHGANAPVQEGSDFLPRI
jgi:hypothetical protein